MVQHRFGRPGDGRGEPASIGLSGRDRAILIARNLSKTFSTPDGKHSTILDEVSVELREGEIVALLGRSGSGKSTLLRSLIGLITPSSGEVLYRGHPVTGPMPGMAMVFQSFALFPWLTVQQNVELGLAAQGTPERERWRRALDVIDLIGLDGFESAFPKELSGGMRQRVGFARALVTNPDVLLMDEPFSALDVLTATSLRDELLDLWQERRIPTRSILMVTHNIEEAVLMADRVLVLTANPGRIREEVPIKLDRPRDRDDEAVRMLVDRIFSIMTTPIAPAPAATQETDDRGIGIPLPPAPISQLTGLMERVAGGPDYGRDDLPLVARDMQLSINDLFALTDAAELLGFARVVDGDILILLPGKAFADGSIQERKQLFARQLAARVPLAAHIRRVLDTRPDHRAPEDRFLRELEDFMTSEEAEATLTTAIEWGRYAELFEYDRSSGVLALETAMAGR